MFLNVWTVLLIGWTWITAESEDTRVKFQCSEFHIEIWTRADSTRTSSWLVYTRLFGSLHGCLRPIKFSLHHSWITQQFSQIIWALVVPPYWRGQCQSYLCWGKSHLIMFVANLLQPTTEMEVWLIRFYFAFKQPDIEDVIGNFGYLRLWKELVE